MNPVVVTQGASPVVLAMPHTGTHIPDHIAADLNENGRALADTDWHIDRLYNGLLDGATIVRATFHRYVIDANRDPSGNSLYPGENTTGLVPVTDFDGQDIWDKPPTPTAIAERSALYHTPYHAALTEQLNRVRDLHGFAILYDSHSIRSHIPFLFDGKLPDFNIGTNNSTTCAQDIEAVVRSACAGATDYSHVLNGRFKGGWTTRHYGQPERGIHAIQMELAQSTYLNSETPPWSYDDDRAGRLRPVLKTILTTLNDWRPA